MSDTIPSIAPPIPKKRSVPTLDEAITRARHYSIAMKFTDPLRAAHHLQMAEWLEELKTLRAAMNMEPKPVHG